MKAKISRGGGFRGALDYVFDAGSKATHTKKPELVGGNLTGRDPRALSRDVRRRSTLRPDVGKPVWHCSLSLPPGERLEAARWNAVASEFLRPHGVRPREHAVGGRAASGHRA